ncbi:hypothetical protein D3C81_1579170 [compost metagenome]
MHAVVQVVGLHVVGNDQFAAPAGVATGEVGLAIAIGVEQLGKLGLFQVGDVLDVVLIGGLLVDQVALQHAGHDVASLDHVLVATGLLVEAGVQFVPQVDAEVGIAVADRQYHRGVFGLLGLLHVVAQLSQALHSDFATETLFIDRWERRGDLHPLPRLVGGCTGTQARYAKRQGAGGLKQTTGERGLAHLRVPFRVVV